MNDMVAQVLAGGGLAELRAIGAESLRASEFYKSLQAGYGTDHQGLTGGAALRRESLEASLVTTVQKNEHFVIWRKLPQGSATATVDEFSKLTDIGGVPGSSANAEMDDIPESTGTYGRETALVKFLMDRRKVSVVAEIQATNGLGSAIARETDNGSKKLLTDANWFCYYGRAGCVSAEFDGLEYILETRGGDSVIDLRGQPITANAKEFIEAAARIWGYANWGRATDYFASPAVQADIDMKLDPAHRVLLNNNAQSIMVGAPVRGINTTMGPIMANVDPFLQETQSPYSVRGTAYAAMVTGSGILPVTSVAGVAATNASSQFLTAHAGNYYYAVEGQGVNGKRSTLVKSAQVAVAAGKSVTVTVTPQASHGATCFAIYRSRRNGTDADADFREVIRIPADGDNPVTYVDHNQKVPGTSIVPVLTINEDAITMRRLLPQTRFPLFPTTKAEHVWAQLLFCYLRVAKPNQHVLIKNVLPSSQTWQPF